MIDRPAWKSHYHVEPVGTEGLVLISEAGVTLLEGELPAAIGPHLDGLHSADQIVERVAAHATRGEVLGLLAELERKGFLGERVESMDAAEAAYWESLGVEPGVAAARLAAVRVGVHAVGGVAVEPLAAALEPQRVQVGSPASLAVVLTDDYLRGELADVNEEALRADRPWMLVRPIGREIWLGPVFRPDRAGCWECLARRLRMNRPVESFLQARGGRDTPLPVPRGSTAATLSIAWNLAASRIAEWIVRGELPSLEGQIVTLDVPSLRVATHIMAWQPGCPACGEPPERAEERVRPVVLASRRKAFSEDGGHRHLPPEATLARFAHQVSPITGAVSELARVGLANDGILHCYSSGHNYASPRGGMRHLRRGFRAQCAGKGASDVQARASALGEALERVSALHRGDEPVVRARLSDLGVEAIHPNACMLFSEAQYRDREAWNARGSRFNFVPVPFDAEAEIEWSPAWSLTHQAVRYLPAALCYFHYPMPEETTYCRSCSNGNAAGNTLEEAILQGFLELAERDGVALWWYNRVRRPAVDLASFETPYLARVSDFLRARGRDLWVIDLTSDLSIPTFAAVSRRDDGPAEQLLFGFGAHLDARIGVLRAVTELNQFLVMSGAVTAMTAADGEDDEVRRWLREATLANHPYLAPDPDAAPHVASDYRMIGSDDLRDDVLHCRSLVERLGMELIVLDQTRPDIGLPVTKVVVPGLRHFWARLAPGRLFETPVRLGWLPRPLTEDQLNPTPMFL